MKLDEAEIRKLVASAVQRGWASYPPDSPLNPQPPKQPQEQAPIPPPAPSQPDQPS